jgi:putative nucleotidyltransferase with HDIG domain
MDKMQISVDDVLMLSGELPFMPLVARKALDIIQDPSSSMLDLANVVSLDQAMAGLVLRWVNSSYYGFRHSVSSVHQAVTYLGTRTVKNLVLTASISGFMNKPTPSYGLERGELWKHSIGVAASAKLLAAKIDRSISEDAYYAGLFCDVGKLAFDALLSSVASPVLDMKDVPFEKLEMEFFGLDHAIIGAELVRRWKLPEHIASVIENHHVPSKANEEIRILTYAVHTADAAMTLFGIGIGRDSFKYELDKSTPEIILWNDEVMEELFDRVIPLITETEEFLKKTIL